MTVRNGLCLLDHPVDTSTLDSTPGRRLAADARRRRGHRRPTPGPAVVDLRPPPAPSVAAGAVAVLEREASPMRAVHRPLPPPPDTVTTDTLSITGLLVEELWNLSPDEDIADWAPSEMDDNLVSNEIRVRKVVALSVVALMVVVTGWRVLTWDSARAAEAIIAVETASERLAATVGLVTPTITDISDGSVADPLGASTTLAELDTAARDLFTAAGDLPVDAEAAPVREAAVAQASDALELKARLAEAVAYGSAVELLTRPIDLPTETDIDGLAEVTERLATWTGDFTSGVGTLPSNELTDTHLAALTALAGSLPDWQSSYLDSLRARDPERASTHVAQLEDQIRFVRDSWAETARSIGDWAAARAETLTLPVAVNR